MLDPHTGALTVGLRDLARHTRAVVEAVAERAEHRVVTDQGRPIALLTPYRAEPTQLPLAAFDALSQAAQDTGDRRRYELVQGELSVTPSPNRNHQYAVGRICGLLNAVAEPLGWVAQPGSDLRAACSVLCPDVMLIPRADETALPTLVVEVTSSNRATDLGLKRDAYAAMGIQAYWVLDRHRQALIVFALGENGYGEPDVHGRDAMAVGSSDRYRLRLARHPVSAQALVSFPHPGT